MRALLAGLAVLASAAALASAKVPKESQDRFRTLYPRVEAKGFEASPLPGLVEVRTDDSVFYFAPESGLLLFGEFFTPAGVSLTGQRREALALQTPTPKDSPKGSAKDLASFGALRVREGAVEVTAYLDVHCGYCAQAVDWLVNKNGLPDAGLNVVFVSRSEQDLALAEHVLCAPKHLRGAALQQVFSRGPAVERLRCEKGRAEALAHEGIAARNGVSATPVFAVKGQTVLGFNRERLESLVDQTGKQPKG